MNERILRPWKILSERELFDAPPFIHITAETVQLPDARVIDSYYHVRMPDVATVYAETEDERAIILRNYRHGIRRICQNFPGGHMIPGEDPAECARRELREETGYKAGALHLLGSYVTNANHRCQTNYLFHATDCRLESAPDSGDLEEIEINLLTRDEVNTALANGDFPFVGQIALLALVRDPSLRIIRSSKES